MESITPKRNNRDIGLDITRIVAFLFVPSAHFFLNAGFYTVPVIGLRMACMVMLRAVFLNAVPLFLLLTGYLLSVKAIPLQWKALKSFYAGLFKVIVTYLLSCVIIFLFRIFWLKEDLMLRDILLFGLGYGGYSWYVNMYIGLYLMIPLLNHIWHSAETKESQIIIVVIFLVLTVAPTVFNIWNWHVDGAILHPWVTDTFDGLIPDWWTDLHPITYYYIGAYIRRNVKVKELPSGKLFLLMTASLLLAGLFNYWRSYSVCFVWGSWCARWGFQNAVNATLIFLFINSIRYKPASEWLRKPIALISDLTFGAYILSWIPDQVTYLVLAAAVSEVPSRIFYFIPYAGKTILISLLLSLVVYLLVLCGRKLRR